MLTLFIFLKLHIYPLLDFIPKQPPFYLVSDRNLSIPLPSGKRFDIPKGTKFRAFRNTENLNEVSINLAENPNFTNRNPEGIDIYLMDFDHKEEIGDDLGDFTVIEGPSWAKDLMTLPFDILRYLTGSNKAPSISFCDPNQDDSLNKDPKANSLRVIWRGENTKMELELWGESFSIRDTSILNGHAYVINPNGSWTLKGKTSFDQLPEEIAKELKTQGRLPLIQESLLEGTNQDIDIYNKNAKKIGSHVIGKDDKGKDALIDATYIRGNKQLYIHFHYEKENDPNKDKNKFLKYQVNIATVDSKGNATVNYAIRRDTLGGITWKRIAWNTDPDYYESIDTMDKMTRLEIFSVFPDFEFILSDY